MSVEGALRVFAEGGMVILVDEEEREDEGDLLLAAEHVTPQAINFMTIYARGLICVPLTGERIDALGLPPMASRNTSLHETAFTVSVDARNGTTTGISAHDRATTVRVLVDPRTRPEDLAIPGHVFPLRARDGGVIARRGHTEAAVDMARLAGLYPAAVICEILAPDGRSARLPQLRVLARRHRLPLVHITDLVAYRYRHEKLVQPVAQAHLPTSLGTFELIAYRERYREKTHLALVVGVPTGSPPPLVRMHSACLTGDALGSLRCDCGFQLASAMEAIAHEGRGIVIYLDQEGRGIGLAEKIRAYALQDHGLDTVEANLCLGHPADAREYGVAAQILADLGVSSARLLTNNPHKVEALRYYGFDVEPIPLPPNLTPWNRGYLETKRDKLGHTILLDIVWEDSA